MAYSRCRSGLRRRRRRLFFTLSTVRFWAGFTACCPPDGVGPPDIPPDRGQVGLPSRIRTMAVVRRTGMCRVRDCFILILMTLAGLAFGLATKAVSQGDSQRSRGEWPQFNGGYDATRFSPLMQINTNNVGSLREVARFKIPETTSFQADPVVIGDTLYVTTLHNTSPVPP